MFGLAFVPLFCSNRDLLFTDAESSLDKGAGGQAFTAGDVNIYALQIDGREGNFVQAWQEGICVYLSA